MEIKKVKTERNYGIDLLRIVSMFFVVALHTYSFGGIFNNIEPFSFKYCVSWFLYLGAYCAVNCYGLIAGYVGYGSNHKYSNIINLYLQTSFYALLSAILYFCLKPESFGAESLLYIAFPFLHGGYWFFGAYFVMFFFVPIINKGIQICEKKYLDMLVIFVLLFFSVFSLVITRDFCDLKNGYSVLWLITAYIFGAYFKKYNVEEKISKIKCIILYFLMVIAMFALKIVWEIYGLKKTGEFVLKGGVFIRYNSLPVLLCAIALVLLFTKLKVGPKLTKVIKFMSPLAFGVYICHTMPFFCSEILNNLFSGVAKLNSALFILASIGAILSIYIGSMIVEFIRSKLFELCRIKKFSIFLENFITKTVSKCFSFIEKDKEMSE